MDFDQNRWILMKIDERSRFRLSQGTLPDLGEFDVSEPSPQSERHPP